MRDTAVCCAPGPSLALDDFADLHYVRDRADVLVINSTYQFAPWANYLYAGDWPWWFAHSDAVQRKFCGECWTIDALAAERFPWINFERDVQGTDMEADGLSWGGDIAAGGGNGGFQGLHLMVRKGYKRILLLGYDMGATGIGHCHPEEDRQANPMPHVFNFWIRGFEQAAPQLRRLGVEVINCTRVTALTAFPRMPIQVLEAAK
jgi:hypothetical protein